MKHIIPISYRGNLYEVVVSTPSILSIRKTMEDSGITEDVDFDSLPYGVKDEILKALDNEQEEN